MKVPCKFCKKKHDGYQGVIKPLCLECYAGSKGLDDNWEIQKSYCRTGRPKGTTQYETAKIDTNHRMTPKGHEFICKNKKLIERMAREPYEIQFKFF